MTAANILALIIYLMCGALLVYRCKRSDPSQPSRFLISVEIAALLALTVHAVDIYFSMRVADGWDLSLLSTMSLISWVMALMAFVFGLRSHYAHPGIIIYPLVAFVLLLKVLVRNHAPSSLATPALEWHVLLSLAAYSLLTLAAIQAGVLAFQERQLRQHQFTGILRQLPPVQSMESGLFQLVVTGLILLTIGLITGFVFIEDIFDQHLVHKTVLSSFAWLTFATLIWGRWRYGWRGQTATRWTLFGFILLALAYLGTKFVLEFILLNQVD